MTEPRFPLFIKLQGRRVVIVGGGNIATRRAQTAIQFGAQVLIIAPELSGALTGLRECGCVCVRERAYQPHDLEGAFLVLAATDDQIVNQQVTAHARAQGILANNASDQDDCDFFFPAVVLTEQASIGICGDGSDHKATRALATKIREEYGV